MSSESLRCCYCHENSRVRLNTIETFLILRNSSSFIIQCVVHTVLLLVFSFARPPSPSSSSLFLPGYY